MTDKAEAELKAKEEGGFGETVKVVIQALLIALVIRTVLFQPFNIPSGSLIPTLLIGDYLFVSKYSYGYSRFSLPQFGDLPGPFRLLQIPMDAVGRIIPADRVLMSEPKRGDVAVFKLPRDGSTDYIKRVIGLPGDRVQMNGGRLFINGVAAPREEATKFATRDVYGRTVEVPTYDESLPGGIKHRIIEVEGDRGYSDNTAEFVVPPKHYFMMGDNRDNSLDSRVAAERDGVGMVPLENFVGRAEVIFFSIDMDVFDQSLFVGVSKLNPYYWVMVMWEMRKLPVAIRWGRLLQPVR